MSRDMVAGLLVRMMSNLPDVKTNITPLLLLFFASLCFSHSSVTDEADHTRQCHCLSKAPNRFRIQTENPSIMSTMKAITLVTLSYLCCSATAYSAPLERQDMAGVWRLKGRSGLPSTITFPMKEFTTYPKKPSPPSEEHLLMLKEDGSFKQYDEETKTSKLAAILHGTWDYVDGKLILAADRPDGGIDRQIHDTILVGRVVAKEQDSLTDSESVLVEEKEEEAKAATDTHLSVPKGAVKVGKFMYPKKHASFFEQPIYQPLSVGSFELKQILGGLNAGVGRKDEELMERFRKADFADRKFLLTNYPIPERVPKGDLRWSIKHNKFVRDPVKQKPKTEEEKNQLVPIRVMEVMLYANNTFMTTAGVGDDTVLRGKWWIVGEERDQFYLQVWRFGFGRSVSGSTFSEGPTLTHDDAKTYWGMINYVDEDDTDEVEGTTFKKSQSMPVAEDGTPRRLQVKGSVIIGMGLEPQPVARFIMREAEVNDDEDDEDYDDDDDDDDELNFKMPTEPTLDSGIDWSDAFQ